MARLDVILRAVADPTRVRILTLLYGREELCVCEMVEALRVPQYHVSRHLRMLRTAGLVCGWRQGRWMHYRINPRLGKVDRALVAAICRCAGAEQRAQADSRRLRSCLRPRAGQSPRLVCCLARERKT